MHVGGVMGSRSVRLSRSECADNIFSTLHSLCSNKAHSADMCDLFAMWALCFVTQNYILPSVQEAICAHPAIPACFPNPLDTPHGVSRFVVAVDYF